MLWSATPSIPARTAQDLLALREAGMPVAWMAPASTLLLAERLKGGSAAAAALLLADSAGVDVVAVDHSGSHALEVPPPVASLVSLDRAGAEFARRLAESGIATSLQPRPTGSLRTGVVLQRDPAVPLTWPGLKRLLFEHGIPSVSHLADLAVEAARLVGIDDPRVVVEGDRVEIALQDAGDVAVGVLHELWCRGVDPQSVLAVVDGLSGVPHRPAPVVVPDVREATVVVVNGGRRSPGTGMVALTGGAARIHQLLADQLRRRRRRSLPEVTNREGWTIGIEGFDLEHERVHEALLSLANGYVGMSGAPLGEHAGRHPWVVAAGAYTGENAASHLLTGPITFALGRLDAGAPLRRVLDLRTGVLHERAGAEGNTVESLRFVSLARPTTAVLRSRYQAALRVGPSVLPAADDATHDAGRSGDVPWIRVAGSTGGITVAAVQTRSRRSTSSERANPGSRVLDRMAAYGSDPDTLPDPGRVVDAAVRASAEGFDRLLAEHRQAWARRWEDADVVIEGDDELQLGIRFAMFHLMASVADSRGGARRRPWPVRHGIRRARVLGRRHLRPPLPGRHPSGGGPVHARVPHPTAARRPRGGTLHRARRGALPVGVRSLRP